jgi:hypothetical protein
MCVCVCTCACRSSLDAPDVFRFLVLLFPILFLFLDFLDAPDDFQHPVVPEECTFGHMQLCLHFLILFSSTRWSSEGCVFAHMKMCHEKNKNRVCCEKTQADVQHQEVLETFF